MTILEKLEGPVQWGYMCLADGGFIKDDTPHEASALIREMAKALSDFLENPAYQVAIGGNPTAVDAMLDRARQALSKVKPLSSPLGSDTDG